MRLGLTAPLLACLPLTDVLADKRVEYVGKLHSLVGYEVAAATMLFLMFVLSLASLYFTVKAVREIKQKQASRRSSARPAPHPAWLRLGLVASSSATLFTASLKLPCTLFPSLMQRESYHEMSTVVGDTLQFEPDLA